MDNFCGTKSIFKPKTQVILSETRVIFKWNNHIVTGVLFLKFISEKQNQQMGKVAWDFGPKKYKPIFDVTVKIQM